MFKAQSSKLSFALGWVFAIVKQRQELTKKTPDMKNNLEYKKEKSDKLDFVTNNLSIHHKNTNNLHTQASLSFC